MKALVLVIVTVWSFGVGGIGNNPHYVLVSSPEQAAIYVYNDKPHPFLVEPDRKTYMLYEVDFEKKSMVEIPIPEIEFKKKEKAND